MGGLLANPAQTGAAVALATTSTFKPASSPTMGANRSKVPSAQLPRFPNLSVPFSARSLWMPLRFAVEADEGPDPERTAEDVQVVAGEKSPRVVAQLTISAS